MKNDDFRRLLLAKQEVLEELNDTGRDAAGIVELDQTRVGRVSRMDAIQAQAMAIESGRRRKIELTRIENALKRLDTGEYGHCLRCDESISDKRLQLDPATTLCISCASDDE